MIIWLLGTALAQDGFDAHRLQLAALDGDPRDTFLLHRPGRMRAGQWFAGGVIEGAQGLLVLVDPVKDERLPWLSDYVGVDLSAGVVAHERVRFDLAFPLSFASRGQDGGQGASAGDLRATATIGLVLPDADDLGFGLGLSGHVDAPTGASARFMGQRTVAGGADLSASYAIGRFTATAEVGAQFNPSVEALNLNGADSFVGGLGVGALLTPRTGLTLESRLAVPLQRAGKSGTETPAELLLTARHRFDSGGFLVGGVATGVSGGAGAATWRAFLGGGFGSQPRKRSPVIVIVPDPTASLEVRALIDGAPVSGASVHLKGPDKDEDHTSSATAWRLDGLAPQTAWQATAELGCYRGVGGASAGGDGSTATLDIPMQPARPGSVRYEVVDSEGKGVPGAVVDWRSPGKGCVEATHLALAPDGTGEQAAGVGSFNLHLSVPDRGVEADRVAVVSAGAETVVRLQLDPPKVKVTETEVMLLEPVYFDFDKDTIKAVSYDVLNQAAATILKHGLTVEVEGHTDWIGSDAYNLDLSTRRAASVVRYLTERGVAVANLTSSGHGEGEPLTTNETDEGRAINRRVVFKILKREK